MSCEAMKKGTETVSSMSTAFSVVCCCCSNTDTCTTGIVNRGSDRAVLVVALTFDAIIDKNIKLMRSSRLFTLSFHVVDYRFFLYEARRMDQGL